MQMKFGKKTIAVIAAVILALSYLVYEYVTNGPFFGGMALDSLSRADRLALKKNIVVMGVDERDGDTGRSDTLFVVMMDPKSNNVSLLSIPRDTMVKIPGRGWDKINHAFAFGGHKLTEQTVEEFLGIQINNYVVIDFRGFKDLVDAIGGIDIDVEKDMYYEDPYDNLVIDLQKGRQHLDGKTAIQYVRYRDEEGDIGRIKRQQHFMAAIYEKVTSSQIITKMPGLVKELLSMVKTDMPLTDMAKVARAMNTTMKEQKGLNMAMVPGEPVYIDEISYWVPDMTDLRQLMVDMQGATMSDKYRMAAEKFEAEYKKVVPDDKLEVTKDEKTDKTVKVLRKTTAEELKKNGSTTDTKKAPTDTSKKGTSQTKSGATSESQTSEQTSKRSVSLKIINCSGRAEALDKAVSMAESAGFIVASTGTGERISSTQVVATNTDGWVVSKLSTLPFSYSMRISRNPDASTEGIVYIGEDFK
ncbi:MAG: LCP family protein [Acholeplasmataceae bacterium]|nr:LCP family protein [Acholeplasmataceae bacterium]